MYEESCAINIGAKERAKRRRFGIIMYLFSAIQAGIMVGSGFGRWWRLLLFVPLSLGGYGYFQAHEKT